MNYLWNNNKYIINNNKQSNYVLKVLFYITNNKLTMEDMASLWFLIEQYIGRAFYLNQILALAKTKALLHFGKKYTLFVYFCISPQLFGLSCNLSEQIENIFEEKS